MITGSSSGFEEMYMDGRYEGEDSLYRKTVDLRQVACNKIRR